MTRTAVFDCFSGIAGDMTLAALIDAGASLDVVRAGLAPLGLPPFTLSTSEVMRGGMRATYLNVAVSEERTYQPGELRAFIGAAAVPGRVRERALRAVEALAAGEAAAHRTATPHLHEAGGVDAVIDLLGSMLAMEDLGIDQSFCPVVTVGAGAIVRAEHGALPASPGPAAAHTLQAARFALRFVEASHELVTPSGAAILAAVARPGAVVITPMTHGCGAGTMDPPNRPNALRIFIGEAVTAVPDGLELREIVQLEANIDDMAPALLAHARDRMMEEGALDAWLEPIGMKKGRAAQRLCVLALPAEERRLAALMMRETTTLGVRVAPYRRYELPRAVETVETSLGRVRVKRSELDGVTRRAPEFEDVKALAAALGRPALAIQRQLEAELARTQT